MNPKCFIATIIYVFMIVPANNKNQTIVLINFF